MKEMSAFEMELDELVASLPPPTPLRAATMPCDKRICFISICGFEPRCYAAATTLAGQGWHADLCICIHYEQPDMEAVNYAHRDRLHEALKVITGGAEPILVMDNEHDLSVDFGTRLLSCLEEAGLDTDSHEASVVFDISVGSSRLLLEGLHALLASGIDLTVVYSEGYDYRPSFSEYLAYVEDRRCKQVPAPEFLSVGVDKVEILKGIPGRDADDRPTCLVGFPSFSPTRFLAVLEELSPSRVEWVFGIPHLVENRWRIDAQRDYHEALNDESHRHCYVSTFHYKESLLVLDRIYRKNRSAYGVVVCSLGSKLQKLGQALFHILRPEVGAVVVTPRAWDPERYSADEPREIYVLPLGDCADLRALLWRTRTLRM